MATECNCLPLYIRILFVGLNRLTKDGNSTSVDSSIQIIENNPDLESQFPSILIGLRYIQEYLLFVRTRKRNPDTNAIFLDILENNETRIIFAFEMAGLEIGNAIKKGDAELLNTFQCKVMLFKARIRKVYGCASTNGRGYFNREVTGFSCVIKKVWNEYDLECDQERWGIARKGLELIETFVIIALSLGRSSEVIGHQVEDFANSINSSVVKAGEAIETAIYEEDFEGLDAISSDILNSIEMWKPKISEAYDFITDYMYQFTTPNNIPFIGEDWSSVAEHLVSNAGNVLHSIWNNDDLRRDLHGIVTALEFLDRCCRDPNYNRIKPLAFLFKQAMANVARILFLGWTDKLMDSQDIVFTISDLLQRTKPTSPQLLKLYMQLLNENLADWNMKTLVVLLLPCRKTSLESYWVGLQYLFRPEHVKLLGLDIQTLVWNVGPLSYSHFITAHDDDELLFQLLQKIALLDVELVFRSPDPIPFKSIYTELSLVKSVLVLALDVYSKRLLSIFKSFEEMVRKVESLNQGSIDVKSVYLGFKLLKIEAILMEQMRCSSCLIPLFHDKIWALSQALELLFKYFSLLSTANQDDKVLILPYVERVGNVNMIPYHFSHSDYLPQHFINKLSDFLTTMLPKVHLMKSEIQYNTLRFRSSLNHTFPMTSQGLCFADIFFEKLTRLMEHKADSIGFQVKQQIMEVLKELGLLRSFLVKVGENHDVDPKMKTIKGLIRRAAYEADYLIDWILLVNCDWNHMLWLYNVIEEMKELNSKSEKSVLQTKELKNGAIQDSKQMIIVQTTSPAAGEAGISLEDEENIIIKRLTNNLFERRIVSISGMPGIGKTTLAKRVYDNTQVRTHFKKVAWCCVSQVYRRRELLYKILTDVTESIADEMDKNNDEELLNMLYRSLKEIRYLVVMDDIWESEAWDDLKSVFPDDQNGSRIMFTTRNENLGFEPEYGSAPHALRFLDADESWELLQQKVFQNKECPRELNKVGQDIAKGCKGLPLSIVAIAGVLKEIKREVDCWKQIENDLITRIHHSPTIQCMGILELSYNHLPDHLKPCFLYFAAFGEDSEVPIQKLVQFWIAEGFIGHGYPNSPEDVAESYVANLIARSLLMPTKIGSNGKVKACKVHDLLYTMCMKKVEEDNFLHYVNGYDKHFPSKSKYDYGIDDLDYPSISMAYEQHRLSISSKRKHFVMVEPTGFPVRTLLFSATSDTKPGCRYPEVTITINNCKILSILDIECINIGSSFPEKIEFHYPLRYLALSGDLSSVPGTIAKLWNLETFIVKGLAGDVAVALPDTLWSMTKLRHLHVSTRASFSLQQGSIECSSKLDNVVSLSYPTLSNGDNSVEMMKLFPNLQKFKCTFSEALQQSMEHSSFPAIDFLEKLESLKVIYYGRRYCKLMGISFPSNLKKLSLSDFSFTGDEFSAIGKLLNLKILKLESIVFEDSSWDIYDDQFQNLEYLKLDSLKITDWRADHLPCLQQVVIRSCNVLKEVPFSFGYINTLQMIELMRCNASTVDSVRKIQQKQIEFSNELFKVVIDGLDAVPRSETAV